jgi:dynein light chain LC8-type
LSRIKPANSILTSACCLCTQDVITFTTEVLSSCPSDDDQAINSVLQTIKEHMDEKYDPSWHVIAGRHFGSLVTHEAKRFVYFYVGDKAIMIYKA